MCASKMQINNYICLQQARLASSQAETAMKMARLQQENSQSSRHLSIVATLFLPLSFASVRPHRIAFNTRPVRLTQAQSWLSTNNTTPLWIFFLITAVSVLFTSMILALLKWLESGGETLTKRVMAVLLGPFVAVSPAPRKARRGPGRELETFDMPKYA